MPDAPEQSAAGRWKRYGRRVVALLVAGVSLYFVLPSLVAVFSSFRALSGVRWWWVLPLLACEGSELRRDLGARPDRAARAHQLARRGVCAPEQATPWARVLPGGGATATAFEVEMLRTAGVDTGRGDRRALGPPTLLQLATTFALPVLAPPAILGRRRSTTACAMAAYLGIAVSVALLAVAAIAFRTTGRSRTPAAQRSGSSTTPSACGSPVSGLPQQSLDRSRLHPHDAGRALEGCSRRRGRTPPASITWRCSARCWRVGADPRPSLVLLAYTTARGARPDPLTPGGLGFVEAALVGTLTLAGVSGRDALAATLLYRLAAYWLPLLAGPVAYVRFRRRYGLRSSRTASAASPIPETAVPSDSRAVNRPAGR